MFYLKRYRLRQLLQRLRLLSLWPRVLCLLALISLLSTGCTIGTKQRIEYIHTSSVETDQAILILDDKPIKVSIGDKVLKTNLSGFYAIPDEDLRAIIGAIYGTSDAIRIDENRP